MKKWNVWIEKGCLDLLFVMAAGITYYLLDLVAGLELDAEDAAGYYIIMGFLISCSDFSDLERRTVLAVRFGATRKSCQMGFEISRAIYILGFLLSLVLLYPVIREMISITLPMLLLTEGAAFTASSSFAGLRKIARKQYTRCKILLGITGLAVELVLLVLMAFSLYTETWILPLILLAVAAAVKPVCLMQERKYLFSCNV